MVKKKELESPFLQWCKIKGKLNMCGEAQGVEQAFSIFLASYFRLIFREEYCTRCGNSMKDGSYINCTILDTQMTLMKYCI